ncbi:MAG: hypothetical protein KA270_05115 [Saprospiraceae bacterium]|nr:hypothetical protein [Saprospiraceae bacterium]MBP6566526.1 hypothetical protein [Saprospiraceae bacterium]
MNNLLKYYLSFFILMLSVFNSTAQSKSKAVENIFAKEKLSLGVGVGVDYGVLGPKVSYSLFKNLHAIFAVSILPKNFVYAGGIEIRMPLKSNTRICPHVFLMYGKDFIVELSDFGKQELERKVFNSINLGFGSKFRLFKTRNSYLSAAITYRFISEKTVNNFVDDFNDRRSLDISIDYKKVLFSLGYSFILMDKK